MSVVEYYLLKRFPVPYGMCHSLQVGEHKTDLFGLTHDNAELTIVSSYSSLLCCCGNYCCFRWATCREEVDICIRTSVTYHLHPCLNNFRECNITRWVSSFPLLCLEVITNSSSPKTFLRPSYSINHFVCILSSRLNSYSFASSFWQVESGSQIWLGRSSAMNTWDSRTFASMQFNYKLVSKKWCERNWS